MRFNTSGFSAHISGPALMLMGQKRHGQEMRTLLASLLPPMRKYTPSLTRDYEAKEIESKSLLLKNELFCAVTFRS